MQAFRALPLTGTTHLALQPFPGFSALRGRPTTKSKLTPREVEVLRWVADGKSAWEIGEILHISKRMVDAHAQAGVRKLGATNRTHAVVLALRDGTIEL
jgi:LuxR family quorum sensing-dependent transcriptional regulator